VTIALTPRVPVSKTEVEKRKMERKVASGG
jgi:hypothetical protein